MPASVENGGGARGDLRSTLYPRNQGLHGERFVDGATLSPYPHLSWLGFDVAGSASSAPLVVTSRGTSCTISLTRAGGHAVRWITRGRETRWTERVGAVHFVPADDEQHTFLTSMSADFAAGVLLIPKGHLDACLVADEVEPRRSIERLLAPDDDVLRRCMTRILAGRASGGALDPVSVEEASRRLILRLLERSTGGKPDWHDDQAVFTARTLTYLCEYVDAHVHIPPSLGEMGQLVGLSPSHFARKFRASTGLSLQRFINRRRIDRALRTLRSGSCDLASLALDLGFSSQSHLTRLFGDLTGMTPARYHKQFRRTVG